MNNELYIMALRPLTVVDAQASGHTVRSWAWFAVPKESIFKLNLLGVQL